MCTCAPGWQGYDCRQPVCTVFLTAAIRAQIVTRDPALFGGIEQDPCGAGGKGHGVCSRPNVCSCACSKRALRTAGGAIATPPYSGWTLNRQPPSVVFGSSDCLAGYEGARNPDGTFATCHLTIYEPTFLELNLLPILGYAAAGLVGVAMLVLGLQEFAKRRAVAARLRKRKRSDGSTGTGTGTGTSAESTQDSQEGDEGRAVSEDNAGAGGAGGEGKRPGVAEKPKAGGWAGLMGTKKK